MRSGADRASQGRTSAVTPTRANWDRDERRPWSRDDPVQRLSEDVGAA
jgi:hypothetical protein